MVCLVGLVCLSVCGCVWLCGCSVFDRGDDVVDEVSGGCVVGCEGWFVDCGGCCGNVCIGWMCVVGFFVVVVVVCVG